MEKFNKKFDLWNVLTRVPPPPYIYLHGSVQFPRGSKIWVGGARAPPPSPRGCATDTWHGHMNALKLVMQKNTRCLLMPSHEVLLRQTLIVM